MDWFVGAYLEIDCKRMTVDEVIRDCENGHRARSEFCPSCGKPIESRTITIQRYPSIIEHIIDEEFVDVLAEVTPANLFGAGKILAKNNGFPGFPNVGDYAYLDDYVDTPIIDIPNGSQQKTIMLKFESGYAEIIQAIRSSPLVQSAVVKFGIVRIEDY